MHTVFPTAAYVTLVNILYCTESDVMHVFGNPA